MPVQDSRFVRVGLRRIRLDERGCIPFDLPCHHCGYNLRQLPLSAACPECGTALERSLRSDHLDTASPQWLRRVSLGLNVLVGTIAMAVGSAVVVAWIEVRTGREISIASFIDLAVTALVAAGFWLATEPDPATIWTERSLSLRRAARWMLMAWAAMDLGSTILMLSQSRFTPIAEIAAQGLYPLAMIPLLLYARQLARRMPDEALANQTMGLLLLMLGVWFLAWAMPGPLAGLSLLAFVVWSLILLFRFRKGLAHAAEYTQRSWERDQAYQARVEEARRAQLRRP